MSKTQVDIAIVGAGIVGLASALHLQQNYPHLSIALLEKESAVAQHQSSHNSGVIHSGIYYQPGSARALNCQRGYRQLLAFCERESIPYDCCGKVIVATQESELPQLDKIYQRGLKNGLQGIQKITAEAVKEIEPHIHSVAAIWVPQAGIVNYGKVAQRYAQLLEKSGVPIFLNAPVRAIERRGQEQIILAGDREVTCRLVLNCAGLYSDKIAALAGQEVPIQILPFRGEYYELVEAKRYYINNLVYPVPNPAFPFLGVHFTRMIEGGIEAGPNAVLAFQREGYSRWDFDRREFWETIRYPGFYQIAKKYWRTGLDELHRSYSKRAFVKTLQRLLPPLELEDLHRGGAGVRAMACGPNGELVDDYLILESPGVISICNAPSPAATSSLSIGQTLAERVVQHLKE